MSVWLNVLLIFVFMLLGGVFSCSEMALVSLRGSQIEQMELEDARGARVARVARDPNRFLSAVQLGVTLAGFLSASFGASAISPYVSPLFVKAGMSERLAGTVSMIVLTLVISYFSIVISELTPKRIALQKSEAIARAVVPAIDTFATICTPVIWLIGHNTNLLVRFVGLDPNETQSEVSDDELRVLVSTNTNLSKDERVILEDVFGAAETSVSEVMRPRADVTFLNGDDPIDKAAAFVRDQPYSRYPVIGKDFDDVLGFVHVRDLLDVRDPAAKTVADVTRQGIKLPGTSKLLPSLSLLRKSGIHLAVVIDEYGGTDGIVTLEDMTEELVGDIRDEYDLPEPSASKARPAFHDGIIDVDGGMTLDDFHELTGVELDDGPYETLAGYVMAHTGEMGRVGMTVQTEFGYDMTVIAVDGRRIQTIRVRKLPAGGDNPEPAGTDGAANAAAGAGGNPGAANAAAGAADAAGVGAAADGR